MFGKYKVTNKEEEILAVCKIVSLREDLEVIREGLDNYRNKVEFKRKKELWENKTFHSMFNDYGFVYVTEVTSDAVKYIGFREHSYPNTGYYIILGESCTHEEFNGASEWVGVGPLFYERVSECLEMLKINLILNNKSEKGKN